MKIQTSLAAMLLLMSAGTCAAENKTEGSMDAAAAFARLKALAGEWQADSSMGKTRVTYEVIAGGTSLVEREWGEKMPVMLTVYHLDGKRLMLTHYCAAGNQPRMQAQSFDPGTGELRFQFLDVTNLTNKDAGHMRNAVLRLTGSERFTAEWEFYQNGKRKSSENFEYTRVK